MLSHCFPFLVPAEEKPPEEAATTRVEKDLSPETNAARAPLGFPPSENSKLQPLKRRRKREHSGNPREFFLVPPFGNDYRRKRVASLAPGAPPARPVGQMWAPGARME